MHLPEGTFALISLARASHMTSLIARHQGSVLFPGALKEKRDTDIRNVSLRLQKLRSQK